MSTPNEKRRYPRIELNSAVLIAASRGGFLSAVQDVSYGGARVLRPLEWQAQGEHYRLFFIFDQDTVIEITSSLLREGDDHLVFTFDDGQDEDVGQMLYETRFATDLG
jgi:hypothetical protein